MRAFVYIAAGIAYLGLVLFDGVYSQFLSLAFILLGLYELKRMHGKGQRHL